MINPHKILHCENFSKPIFTIEYNISKEALIEHGYPNYIDVQMEDGTIIRYWINACIPEK